MMRKLNLTSQLPLIALLCASCSSTDGGAATSYQVAPSFREAPQPVAVAIPIGTSSTGNTDSTSSDGNSAPRRESEVRQELQAQAAALRAEEAQRQADALNSLSSEFEQAYSDRGRPRIAVFLNRELSDSVLEWSTAHGVSFDVEGVPRAYVTQTRNELGGSRPMPETAWLWDFEDGFCSPMRAAGLQFIDRAAIMRLATAADGGTGAPDSPLSVRQVEMDALKGHADLFIELLVEPAESEGFRLRARAIEVQTGTVQAVAESSGMAPTPRRLPILTEKAVRVGNTGYMIVEVSVDPNLDLGSLTRGPRESARELAYFTMDELISTWRR